MDVPALPAFTVRGPIARDDLDGLSARVCALLASLPLGDVLCRVDGVPPDAVTVDALARLQLAASRRGVRVHLSGASGDLQALVALMGLTDVLPLAPAPR